MESSLRGPQREVQNFEMLSVTYVTHESHFVFLEVDIEKKE